MGYSVILIGTAMAAVGGISTIVQFCFRWTASNRRIREITITVGLLALIGSNFVIALFLVMMVAKIANFHHGM